MKPMKQFMCDVCGEIIESPEDGYVVWKKTDDGLIADMRIVHKSVISDDGDMDGCDKDDSYDCSLDVGSFLGDKGRARLLSYLDPGENFGDEYQQSFTATRIFIEYFRRFQCPYYEEARLFWSEAYADGFFNSNPVGIYMPDTLRSLIRHYKKAKAE